MAKIHRFISNFDLSKNPASPHTNSRVGWELEITDKEIVNQMKNVLKLKAGELVELCDGKDASIMAEIIEINKDEILVKISNSTPLRSPSCAGQNSTKKVNLFCAVLKKENFELVVQKTTECGASKIIPIITSRTIKTGLNIERLRKIAKEASEQCGRINIPEILEPIKFEEALKNLQGENILFDASGELLFEMPWEARQHRTEKISSKKFLCISNSNSPCSIWIGPEGGWTEKEINITRSLNFKTASLGPLTLRGETAAIVATYLVSNIK
jgi:16S rRNA (uracil1498-N3)-methyltransferase